MPFVSCPSDAGVLHVLYLILHGYTFELIRAYTQEYDGLLTYIFEAAAMALSMGIPPAVSIFKNVGNASFASRSLEGPLVANEDFARGGIRKYT